MAGPDGGGGGDGGAAGGATCASGAAGGAAGDPGGLLSAAAMAPSVVATLPQQQLPRGLPPESISLPESMSHVPVLAKTTSGGPPLARTISASLRRRSAIVCGREVLCH